MPILPPSLDDRRFDDLVDELLARIPAHTPEWTNPRLGDPGRTLIELFAWLGDTLLYRANLIPPRQHLVFLKLLGQQLKPALPATGVVGLAYAQETERSASSLAPGGRISGPVPFETLAETTVLPVSAEAYYKRSLTDAESARMAEVIEGLKSVHKLADAHGYETTPVFDSSRAERDGIDLFALSADKALWLALLAPKAPQPDQQPQVNDAVRNTLGGGITGAPALLSVGIVPAQVLPKKFDDFIDAANPPTPVPVMWEITTRGKDANSTDYLTLAPEAGTDTTAALTRPGVLRLGLPNQDLIWAPSNDVIDNPAAGVGDTPPRLDDADKAARLIAWIRLRPQPNKPVASLPLSWIGINAVPIDQRITVAGRVLGVSTGAADQVFQLPLASCDADTLKIEVEEPGLGYQPWYRVDDLAAISADVQVARSAAAYELDAEAGTVRFGDGVRGRAPEAQMRIRLASGRFGGGVAGNLPAGSLTAITATTVAGTAAPTMKVLQPLATDGGVDAETLPQAERRIPAFLRHRDRAVTAEDYKQLALQTPATAVGRVEVLPRFKPRDRRQDVAGVVSVMALPAQAFDATANGGPNPRPDRPFIEKVHSWLSTRVPLSTELYVIGCEYVALGLSVSITIRDGYGRDAVLFDVRQALRRLLWPLPPGGHDGNGWPLGCDVRERELDVEISRVGGVLELTGLTLFQRNVSGAANTWRPINASKDGTRTLVLREWQLPELLSVLIVEGSHAPASLAALPNPFVDPRAIAVPIVPPLICDC
jgi:predicted phage baseplate assembly protein